MARCRQCRAHRGHQPFTEISIGGVPQCGATEVDAAVRAARSAFVSWSASTVGQRCALLEKLHRGLLARSDEIAHLITSEVGTPLRMSQRLQLSLPLTTLSLTIELLRNFVFKEPLAKGP